jgi:hypothetical protein
MKIPTREVHTCSYCGPGITHFIDPIDHPNDVLAYKDDKGKWVCGTCFEKSIEDRIIAVIPRSERAKEILEERKREEGRKLQLKMFEAKLKHMSGKLT